MADCVDDRGNPITHCSRARLQTLERKLQEITESQVLVGFELELTLVRERHQGVGDIAYDLINFEHGWCSMTSEDRTFLPVIEAMVQSILSVGVQINHFHAEGAPGQWEFALAPLPPREAVDSYIRARQTVGLVAESFGWRATCHPRLSTEYAGTGAHAHISLNRSTAHGRAPVEHFLAGITNHMPSVSAFSLSQDVSYDRVNAGIRSCGEFAGWGWNDKEAPVRRVADNRFEFRLMDGLGNPYLALAAIFAAGINGIQTRAPLAPAMGYNLICQEKSIRLPRDLKESLLHLEQDAPLQQVLGTSLSSAYIAVKRRESEEIQSLGKDKRRAWLIANF